MTIDKEDIYERAQLLAEKLPAQEAVTALRKIKRRYPRNKAIDLYLFQALDKVGLKEAATPYLSAAIEGWESLRIDAKDRLVDSYCARTIKDPTHDYLSEGLLAPSKFIENGVRARLRERLASNPKDVEALRWMGALSAGAESVFYLRLAIEADPNESFSRRRLLKHFAEKFAFSVQKLPTSWNGSFEQDKLLLNYAEQLLLDLERVNPEDAKYWRKMFDGFSTLADEFARRGTKKK